MHKILYGFHSPEKLEKLKKKFPSRRFAPRLVQVPNKSVLRGKLSENQASC
mgnify:CR=1 FL=1